jgi:predicted NAD-dependent protein-ADP-ribosyltransferase YbiA (DUF1768 family)
MDIRSGKTYPSSALSNFAPHPFVIDGVECNSMEGFLQSLKFKNPEMQKEVCKLVGYAAKKKGKYKKNWDKTLWWQGKKYDRFKDEYQILLNRAYTALAQNKKFQKALLASGNAVLTHSIGKRKEKDTILTVREFCGRLTYMRKKLQEWQKDKEKQNGKK